MIKLCAQDLGFSTARGHTQTQEPFCSRLPRLALNLGWGFNPFSIGFHGYYLHTSFASCIISSPVYCLISPSLFDPIFFFFFFFTYSTVYSLLPLMLGSRFLNSKKGKGRNILCCRENAPIYTKLHAWDRVFANCDGDGDGDGGGDGDDMQLTLCGEGFCDSFVALRPDIETLHFLLLFLFPFSFFFSFPYYLLPTLYPPLDPLAPVIPRFRREYIKYTMVTLSSKLPKNVTSATPKSLSIIIIY